MQLALALRTQVRDDEERHLRPVGQVSEEGVHFAAIPPAEAPMPTIRGRSGFISLLVTPRCRHRDRSDDQLFCA
jgi:hypothetical protein